MTRFDIARTRAAVQHNCNVADARHAQGYSLCVYLLKMRELYRWEQGLALSAPLSRDAVGDWVEAREQLWDTVECADFQPVPVAGESFDPFDVGAINTRLRRRGLAYGGGFGRFGQPNFFLARLERVERAGRLSVLVCGKEHARDLSAPPAMLLGNRAFVRLESLRRQLWEAVEEWRWRRPPGPVAWLHAHYAFEHDAEAALDRMVADEVGSAVLHERGEHRLRVLLGEAWPEAIVAVAGRPEELVLRAVGDHLADALVTLPAIVAREDGCALMRFHAGLRGHRKDLAPALVARLAAWQHDGRWSGLAELVERGRAHWLAVAGAVVDGQRGRPEALATVLDPDALRFAA
jgi:hypothetical protein